MIRWLRLCDVHLTLVFLFVRDHAQDMIAMVDAYPTAPPPLRFARISELSSSFVRTPTVQRLSTVALATHNRCRALIIGVEHVKAFSLGSGAR